MGSPWKIFIPPPLPESVLAGLPEKCASLLERCEEQLSRWRDGPVAQLNRLAGTGDLDPGNDLWRNLVRLSHLSRLTGGAFDFLLGRLVDLWGFGPGGIKNRVRSPSGQILKDAREASGIRHLYLDHARRSAGIRCPGAIMDLGGAGKGIALEKIETLLRGRGIRNALVNLGGSSILALGNQPEEHGWILDLAGSPSNFPDGCILLHNRCLTTSGTTISRISHPKNTYGHIIHPKSSTPIPGGIRVSVKTKNPLLGEVIATAWPLMDSQRRQIIFNRYPGISVIEFPPGGGMLEFPGPIPGLRFPKPGKWKTGAYNQASL